LNSREACGNVNFRPGIPQMLSLGWGILVDLPDREIVMAPVTRPWEPNPRFHAISAGQFAAFNDAEYIKIVWSLRADRLGPDESMFRTETRAVDFSEFSRRALDHALSVARGYGSTVTVLHVVAPAPAAVAGGYYFGSENPPPLLLR
jgi:hypothetical protein